MALDYLTWWLISPGVACFLLLNVLVAAIAFTSRSRSRAQQGEGGRVASTRRRLCRNASSMVLDRLQSFAKHPSIDFYYMSPEAEELKQVSGAAPCRQLAMPEPEPEPATTAAISMSRNADDETEAATVKSTVSSDDGNGTCALGQEGRHAQEPTPSSPPAAAPAAVAMVTAAETARVAPALVVRGPPKDKEEPAATVAEFVKRKHRRRDRACAVEGKAELNARAEQFIRQFRHELKLQRLDSLLGCHTHTPGTGSGAPTSR